MDKLEIKETLLDEVEALIYQKIAVFQKMMDDAQDSANNETKSSAGDKFETGRAMMHMERDKNAQQLSEARKLELFLSQIKSDKMFDRVAFGSVVQTDFGNYFISIAAGRILVDEKKYFAISPQAPLAKELMQKEKGDMITFNDKPIKILDVF
ncbi:MAG: transcription elongation GreA/GreB family factor [Granulosicoccus sp.]|jgi:transcription elongation GreA/GreB family factor